MLEGTEQCEDPTTVPAGTLPAPFDGCSPTCKLEPSCAAGVCTPACGDGIILRNSGEDCDDGNLLSGDGCSSECASEQGFECVVEPASLPTEIRLPIIVRDFRGLAWCDHATACDIADDPDNWHFLASGFHPDFNDPNDSNGAITHGLVQSTLDAEGRPVLAYVSAPGSDDDGDPKTRTGFAQWYRDDALNIPLVRELVLTGSGGTYTFDSDPDGFYPIDDAGWVVAGTNPENEQYADDGVNDGQLHNFNFTTETHFWFQYEGDEVLTFSGDDDLWVLMVIFHAERHQNASNFSLTLTDFQRNTSRCTPDCGDGYVTRAEACDLGDGVNSDPPEYNGCSTSCELGPYCGDGMTTPGEEVCDDGANTGGYGFCAPGCDSIAECGDGIRQIQEQCDAGDQNGQPGSTCSVDCELSIVPL